MNTKLQKGMKQMLLPSTAKFNVYKIQKNQLSVGPQIQQSQYIFQQTVSNQKSPTQKQNIEADKDRKQRQRACQKKQIPKLAQSKAKSLMSQLNFVNKNIAYIQNKTKNTGNQGEKNKCKNDNMEQIGNIELVQSQEQLLEEHDLTQLWNKLQQQQQQRYKIQPQKVLGSSHSPSPSIGNQKLQVQKQLQSDSSCQLTQQQLRKWMESCQKQSQKQQLDQLKKLQDSPSLRRQQSVSRHSNRSNCIYHADQTDPEKQSEPSKQKQMENQWEKKQQIDQWGEWADAAQFLMACDRENVGENQLENQLEGREKKIEDEYNNSGLVNLANATDREDFIVIDSKFDNFQGFEENEKEKEPKYMKQSQMQNMQFTNFTKYGPWHYDLSTYQIYQTHQVKLVHELYQQLDKSLSISRQKMKKIYSSARPIRKINWQVSQQKKPQIMKLRSKRICRMALLQYGKDFLIFDHVRFALSPIKDGTHVYFGLRAFGNFSQVDNNQNMCQGKTIKEVRQTQATSAKELKQFLYFPTNGECFLETNYKNMANKFNESQIKQFDIHLSLTNQKIAVCQRYILNQQKDKKQIIQVRVYDSFQKAPDYYLGIIQTKISNFSEQWYCDTLIHIPKKKIHSPKSFSLSSLSSSSPSAVSSSSSLSCSPGPSSQKNWQKFRIQLRISQLGIIVAQLGIFDAQSSVTNCILFSENKHSQFMMGTIMENFSQINYILRVAGLSPVMAFVTAVSRKIFVVSS